MPSGDSWPERTIRVASTEPDPAPTGSSRPPAYASLRSQWWDASQIYGGDSTTAESLRTHAQGHLRLGRKDLLPVDPETGLHMSGFRRDWWVGLAMLHTLFTREHNYVCDRLASHNPSWSDDELFEKARLVISALLMKIHLTEWLTALVPNRTASETFKANWSGLAGNELRDAKSFLNDSETFAGVVGSPADHFNAPYALTEELASIYRMHPLLPDDLEFRSAVTGMALGRCSFVEASGRGAADISGRMSTTDLLYSLGISYPGAIGLHNYPRFLQDLHGEDGQHVDLAAVDILRDRERGVPRYNEFLRLIRKEPVRSFDELTDSPAWRQEIKETYNNDLDKVDLMTGLYAEPLPEGFGVSESAFRILLLMTSRQIKSDRFFTADYKPEVYTEVGFEHIRENTLGTTLLRHYPELQPFMSGLENAFHPWKKR